MHGYPSLGGALIPITGNQDEPTEQFTAKMKNDLMNRKTLTVIGFMVGMSFVHVDGMPLEFLANGTLTRLKLGGVDLLRLTDQRGGFSALWFDGSRVKEIAFENVTVKNSNLLVTAPNGFPRLEFAVTEESGRLHLDLVRVEGMPAGRDVSILFRATLASACQVQATGNGVELEGGPTEVRAFWTSLGQQKTATSWGGISIQPGLK